MGGGGGQNLAKVLNLGLQVFSHNFLVFTLVGVYIGGGGSNPIFAFLPPVEENFALGESDPLRFTFLANSDFFPKFQFWSDSFLYWFPDEWDNISEIHLPVKDVWRPDTYLYNK